MYTVCTKYYEYRSKNEDIIKKLSIPSTVYTLDGIRPDLLLFRCLAACLVMWDYNVNSCSGTGSTVGVRPTEEWLTSCIPQVW